MKLSDLVKDISNMSEAELMAHVQEIRNNKYVAKPAVRKREADVEKKEHNADKRSVNKLVDGMSDAEKLALLKLLEGDNG